MALRVREGAIRSGLPRVAFFAEAGGARQIVAFIFSRGSREVGRAHRTWPDDSLIDDETGDGSASISEAAAFEPYSAVQIEATGGPLPLPPGWALRHLFAEDEEAFEAIFFKARDRPADPETQMFATMQLMTHYAVNESHRCVAAVVQGYRAIDLARPEFTNRAVTDLQHQLTRVNDLPVSWRPRLDGVHLAASMHAALWQLLLFDNRGDAAIAQLDKMIAYLRSLHEPLATIVINACPALLIRAHLLLSEGRQAEAVEMAYFNVEFYVSNLQRLKRLRKLFKEMLPPHNIVMLALDLAERSKKGSKGLDAAVIANASVRVDPLSPGHGVILANYEALRRRLRRRRTAASLT